MDLKEDFALKMLPESFKYVAELIGLEQAIVIAKHFSGTMIYIPKIEDYYFRHCRNKLIVDDYKG